jgi:hypothetical protein
MTRRLTMAVVICSLVLLPATGAFAGRKKPRRGIKRPNRSGLIVPARGSLADRMTQEDIADELFYEEHMAHPECTHEIVRVVITRAFRGTDWDELWSVRSCRTLTRYQITLTPPPGPKQRGEFEMEVLGQELLEAAPPAATATPGPKSP